MTDSKEDGFTPGPWWACIGDDQPVPYYRGLVMYVSHDPKITICTGVEGDKSGRTVDSSEWEANARLIAAAPDMYEALRDAWALIFTLGRPEVDDAHHAACEKIKAALLLARKSASEGRGE